GGDAYRPGHVLGAHELRRRLELRRRAQVRGDAAVEDVGAPLLERAVARGGLVGRPRQLDLQAHRLALPAALAEGVDELVQLVARLRHGDQAVGPGAGPARGLRAEGGGEQRRRCVWQAVEPGAVHDYFAEVADLLAAPQRAHHLGRLAQARVAAVLGRPGLAGDALVERFAAADRQPEAVAVHHGEGRRRLRDHRRVVAAARGVDHAEWQRRGRHRRAQPGPGVAAVALRAAPGVEVVRAHRRAEPGLLGALDQAQQGVGRELFVRGVVADPGHGAQSAAKAIVVINA